MASLLLVTADPDSASKIEILAVELGFRTRIVATLSAAQEWLAMSTFDALLVDYRFGEADVVKTLEFSWKHHPLLLGGVFLLNAKIPNDWLMQAAGAAVFCIRSEGDNALEQIKIALQHLLDTKPTNTPFRILLVEDLDSPRDIICAYIENLGFSDVEGCSTCHEALRKLEDEPSRYACIVTDLSLPGESGIDLIRAVRRNEELCHLPIIVLTAYSTIGNLLDALRAGASGFIVKPPKKNLLRKELEKARRMFFTHQNPRLCRPEDAHLLEEALNHSDLL